MAKILLNVDDSLLSSALLAALSRSETLDAYVGEAIRRAVDDRPAPATTMDSTALLAKLLERAAAVAPGKQFYLDDLCKPDEWNALSNGSRKSLGKEFRKAVERPPTPIAHHDGRTSSNKAIYLRIEENT